MPPTSPAKRAKRSPAVKPLLQRSTRVFTPALHEKFRRAVRRICATRSPKFVKSRRAYVLRKRTFKGAHSTLSRAFGPLHAIIAAGPPSEGNDTRSRTMTSRGSRIGRELCKAAAAAKPTLKTKAKAGKTPWQPHKWTPAVQQALREWGIYLVDGEVPVCKGHIATGIDLLGVKWHPKSQTWRLICIELKTGYRGPIWRASPLGLTAAGVPRSVLNYALTQAQLTHACATKTLKEYEFEPPLVVLVNDDGVSRYDASNDQIKAQCKSLMLLKKRPGK